MDSERASSNSTSPTKLLDIDGKQTEILILGGLSGRIDQTIHTLSYVHKLRNDNRRVYVITDENIGWVLKEVSISAIDDCMYALF